MSASTAFGALLITLFLYLLSQEPGIESYRLVNELQLTLEQVINTGDMLWHFVWMDKVIYKQLVSSLSTEPEYDSVIEKLKML